MKNILFCSALITLMFGGTLARAAQPAGSGPATKTDAPTSKTLAAPAALTEKQKIDTLIKAVADSGLKFIREGTAYDSKKAAAHLQDKYDYALKHVKGAKDMTARVFIKEIASSSSLWKTGYYIVLKDGTKVPSGVWLTQKLNALEQPEKPPLKLPDAAPAATRQPATRTGER